MSGFSVVFAVVTLARPDALEPAELGDVRLGGCVAVKVEDFIRERMTSDFAKSNVVGEARRAFEERSDDRAKDYGTWLGEFWGKLMLAASRAAVYRHDERLKAFLHAEARRLMALQDEDGYLCTYADPEFIEMSGRTPKDWCEFGWPSNWNLWCLKYTIWGMLRVARLTGDRELVASVERQMDHWIAQLRRRGLSLLDTGNPAIGGLASMSVLKPLTELYRETGKTAYLDYAKEIAADWDRADGWSVRLTPVANADVAGAWTATFTRDGESFSVGVCDFASAADSWYGYYADAFSVWF